MFLKGFSLIKKYNHFPIQDIMMCKKYKYSKQPEVLVTTVFINQNVVVLKIKRLLISFTKRVSSK